MTEQKPPFIDLPEALPLFPLDGALLLPRGQLPLNIFEPRYVQMIDDALRTDRLIGMIQTRPQTDENDADNFYDIGCAGKITHFEEHPDNTYFIQLTGISRFKHERLQETNTPYLVSSASWDDFANDLHPPTDLNLDRERLKILLSDYFKDQGFDCASDIIDNALDEKIVTCLSMICPFTPPEKQALLEAKNSAARTEKFMTMLELSMHKICPEGKGN